MRSKEAFAAAAATSCFLMNVLWFYVCECVCIAYVCLDAVYLVSI